MVSSIPVKHELILNWSIWLMDGNLTYFYPSAGAVEYTNCFLAEANTTPTSVLYMTLNTQMARFH